MVKRVLLSSLLVISLCQPTFAVEPNHEQSGCRAIFVTALLGSTLFAPIAWHLESKREKAMQEAAMEQELEPLPHAEEHAKEIEERKRKTWEIVEAKLLWNAQKLDQGMKKALKQSSKSDYKESDTLLEYAAKRMERAGISPEAQDEVTSKLQEWVAKAGREDGYKPRSRLVTERLVAQAVYVSSASAQNAVDLQLAHQSFKAASSAEVLDIFISDPDGEMDEASQTFWGMGLELTSDALARKAENLFDERIAVLLIKTVPDSKHEKPPVEAAEQIAP